MPRSLHACLSLIVAVFTVAATTAHAAPLPKTDAERNCWQRYTRERTRVDLKGLTAVSFSNLRNGYRVRSPFLVEFGIKGMGVVPAGKVLENTGHHHILVDTAMPPSVTDKLPFNDGHRHFGKGQTFAVLDLPPGKHTLRLLFADHDHRPYFVFSPEITVEVTGKRTAEPLRIDPADLEASCAAWYQDEQARPRAPGEWVTVTNVRDGEALVSPFTLQFGVEGYGVCAKGQSAERTGHFMLDVLRDGRVVQASDLSNGATQANVFVPPGSYQLRLRFVDGKTQRDLLPPYEQGVVVTAQERL
ncbi:DUF4399 domain-containing protein [Piscinibacter sp.]|uniref:DUF4399 domain-containing protein n=1 Tax=Piscinibacter sp. TaxID=1903157 RepID=UPI0039E360EA